MSYIQPIQNPKTLFLDTTEVQSTVNNTLTTMATYTMPAGTMAVGSMLRLRMAGFYNPEATAFDWTVKLGSTSATINVISIVNSVNYWVELEALIINDNSLSVQNIIQKAHLREQDDGGNKFIFQEANVAMAENTANELIILLQWKPGSSSNVFDYKYSSIELINNPAA